MMPGTAAQTSNKRPPFERRRRADSAAQLVALLDTLVCVVEPASGRCCYSNPAFEVVFGPAGDWGFLEWIEQQLGAAAFDSPVQIDLRHLPADRWYRVQAQDVDWQGEPARLFSLTDISDRVDIERHRQVNQQRLFFTTRDLSVGEMGSVLAHELKHPLATIINLVNGIERRLQKPATQPAELQQALAMTRLQAERANAIIARVREFVRRREPRREPLAIGELLASVARLMALDTAAHHVRVSFAIEPNLPQVPADRLMLEQVLLNLIKNAIEAMADAPLQARFLRLSADGEAGQVVVSVIDSGAGIGPEAQERLFNPFYSTKAEGLGIGLALCRSLIEYHGGTLTFANNAGSGCAFSFTLPCGESL